MPDKKNILSCAWGDYLNKAIRDYDSFCTQSVPLEAKDFALYHNACKSALAHIVMLKKLMQSNEQKEIEPDFFDLLEQARKATNEDNDSNSFD